MAALDAPRWRENRLSKLTASNGVTLTREDWNLWCLATTYKLDLMEFDWFIGALEALILTNDKFNFFVNHQHPDVTSGTPAQMLLLKQAVITYLVAHGL
eukprot:1111626-Rhodomonas_salina.1